MRFKFGFKNVRSKARIVTSALSLCAAVILPAGHASAQIAPSPCDPDYYQSLEQRAWLEAQREITQNQNLIFKPDSVLAYTCFHGHLYELGEHASDMFSENTRWGSNVLGSGQAMHMNNALSRLVAQALGTYLDSNFTSTSDRRFLGGRTTVARPAPGTYTSVPNGRSYTCNIMQRVWDISKCYNFQTLAQDGFFTFQEYAGGSTNARSLPTACGAEPTSLYNTAIEEAMTNPPWPIDSTLTYLANFDAASCGESDMLPIATGVIVTRPHQTPTRYFEGVCIQPGCHYRPTGGVGGNPRAAGTCAP